MTGIPRSTITKWRDQSINGTRAMIQAAASSETASLSQPDTINARITDLAREITEKAAVALEIALDRLIRDLTDTSKQHQLRDIAVAAGILRDIHLDYRDGRRNAAAVQVNNNSIKVTAEAIELIKAQAKDLIIDAEEPPGA